MDVIISMSQKGKAVFHKKVALLIQALSLNKVHFLSNAREVVNEKGHMATILTFALSKALSQVTAEEKLRDVFASLPEVTIYKVLFNREETSALNLLESGVDGAHEFQVSEWFMEEISKEIPRLKELITAHFDVRPPISGACMMILNEHLQDVNYSRYTECTSYDYDRSYQDAHRASALRAFVTKMIHDFYEHKALFDTLYSYDVFFTHSSNHRLSLRVTPKVNLLNALKQANRLSTEQAINELGTCNEAFIRSQLNHLSKTSDQWKGYENNSIYLLEGVPQGDMEQIKAIILDAKAGEARLTRNKATGTRVLKVENIKQIKLLGIKSQVVSDKPYDLINKIDETLFSLRNGLPMSGFIAEEKTSPVFIHSK